MSDNEPARRTALVTGGNRGIGLAVVAALRDAGLDVVVTARRLVDARSAVEQLSSGGRRGALLAAELDLASEHSVTVCAEQLAVRGIAIDVLVNNGGVLCEGSVLDADAEAFRRSLDVNLLGALWCCRAFVPPMLQRGYGRVVNVSSGWGCFAEGMAGPASYAISKAALNALTVSLAQSVHGDVKVNACCPGWVRTRMGGDDADLSPERAAGGIVWLATLPACGPQGGIFRDQLPIGW